MQETIRKSDAPLYVKYLQTMVECLCMLGKVSAAGAIIWLVILIIFILFNKTLFPYLFEGFDLLFSISFY